MLAPGAFVFDTRIRDGGRARVSMGGPSEGTWCHHGSIIYSHRRELSAQELRSTNASRRRAPVARTAAWSWAAVLPSAERSKSGTL